MQGKSYWKSTGKVSLNKLAPIGVAIAFVILMAISTKPAMALQTEAMREVPPSRKPNFVFAIADDWGWPHASAYGDEGVKTPNFDAIASKGVLFQRAFVSSPSCTPSRGAILSGQHFWRLGPAANLWSEWPSNMIPEYPALLRDEGYFTGHYRKAWGPGKSKAQPAGKRFKSVDAFFDARPTDKPFCFWFGAFDPHRGYKKGSGMEAGIDLSKVHLFSHFPDTPEVRNDVADYYFEVQRFDRELGDLIRKLEAIGELDNTYIVVTGDHGMPFPRCKGHLYDSGTRVPVAISGPTIPGNRQLTDFVSLTDIAPTFLELAGLDAQAQMTGKSLVSILQSEKTGQVDAARDHVVFGRERHTVGQEIGNRGGYPMRAIRTDDYLLIRNFFPERWPAGTPNYDRAENKKAWLSDCDNGPTKDVIWNLKDTETGKQIYDLSFGKRPAIELYHLATDPNQTNNRADDPKLEEVKQQLATRLAKAMKDSDDPRSIEPLGTMDQSGEYLGGGGGQWQGK